MLKMKALCWLLPPLLLLQGAVVSSTSSSLAPSYGKYINTPCAATSDCGLDNHLQCINNYCQCDHYSQIYDQSTHKCLLLLRQKCQGVSGTTSEKHHHDYHQPSVIKCVPNSDCIDSTCRCRRGYKASVDFLCKPDYGSPCFHDEDCDDAQGLLCSNTLGTCQCFNSTWSFHGQFGCVDKKNPQYNEMLRLLNQTETLLKENNLELKDMFNDLGLQNDPDHPADLTVSNVLASARQFQDTYNTNDLQFAAQNQDPQQSGGSGLNLQQLLSLFQTFQSLIPRNNNNNSGGGGGIGRGFFRNLFRGNQGGYPEASTTTAAPSGGYGAPGQPEGMGQRMGLLNSFLNLFNQMIPIVRQLRMRFSPVRFIQNLINRFSPSTTTTTAAPAPAAAAIHNAPPTIIDTNGNYQSNPIFDNSHGQEQSGGQGQGSFRFFMRSRERFRNFLRGNNQGGGGGGGGYDYTPANPPDKGYGAPPPPAESPPPAEGDAPAPAPAEGAGTSFQNYYTNNPRAGFHGQSSQSQYSTVHATSFGNHQQHQQIPQSAASPAPPQRQQYDGLPRPSTFNSGLHPNPQSFFPASPNNNNHGSNSQFGANNNHNNNHNHENHIGFQQQNHFNAQATSHHQTTFVPHPQPANSHAHHHPASPPAPNNHNNHIFDSNTNSFVRHASPAPAAPVPSVTASPPPPIPQFKLQVQSQSPKQPSHESPLQNFILSEADDPHPGFTPHTTQPSPPVEHALTSFRTSARFERIGQEEQQQQNTAAQNWRESFRK